MNNIKKNKENGSFPTVNIERLSHDGRGIGHLNGMVSFIANALPQETVTVLLHQKHPTYYEGTATDWITQSDQRITPPCPHFGVCGGCQLQYMSTAQQVQFKMDALLQQLQHFGNIQPISILPPLLSTDYGYRRKARLGVKFVIKKDRLLIGFREKKSRYLADLESCAILHPKIGMHFDALRDCIGHLSIVHDIPQVEVAMGDDDCALVFRHMKPFSEDDLMQLKNFGAEHAFHIYLQPNAPEPITKLWPADHNERISYTLPDQALQFLFHPLDFTQINLEMNRAMINQAITLLNPTATESVLDLFCGIGNFSLPLAQKAKSVLGVEGSAEMVERAYENARHNKIDNVNFIAANLQDETYAAEWLHQQFDKILLDPPRTGAKEILPHIDKWQPSRIVYVSCNPATLARDAGDLVHRYHYQLTSLGIMNMFPHTSHVEAIAVFDRIKRK